MFRSLRLYRLHSAWPDSEDDLSNQLHNCAFQPCGSLTERSSGWEVPAEGYPMLARRVGGADLVQLREQTRVLPAAAINEALDERIAEFEARTQRKPGRKEKRDLKDEVHAQLLPRSLLKSDRIQGFYIASEQLLGVGAGSEPPAERFLDTLRESLGSLDVTPLEFEKPVASLLASAYLGGGPGNLTVGRECRMVDPGGSGASVTWTDIDITDGSVQRHVRDGLKVDRLALAYGEMMTFVLDEQAVLRKIRLSGDEVNDSLEDEDPLAQLDARFTLFTGTLTRLIRDLSNTLGGYA